MSSHTEYYYTATPSVPSCHGKGCYCFYGSNPLNETISDTESEYEEEWAILDDCEWGVSLNETKFRHPRVLLSYFNFVANHNELAPEEEKIEIPTIPKYVLTYILDHISLKEPCSDFLPEITLLKSYLTMYS